MSQSISLAYKGKQIKKAPWWIAILDAATSWGVPPWKLVGGTKTLWLMRYQARRDATIAYAPKPKEDK